MSKAYFNPKMLGLVAVILFTLSSNAAFATPGAAFTAEPLQSNELHTMVYVMPNSSITYFIRELNPIDGIEFAAVQIDLP